MNEQQVRKIVDDEIKKKLFQLPKVPPHKHDGTDNINIPSTSVIPPVRAIGTRVCFKNNQIYTFYFPSVYPQIVLFEGYALQNTSIGSFTMTSPLSQSATFGTLTSVWGGTTATLLVSFSSGETRSVTFTNGSLTIYWNPGLSYPANTIATYQTSAAFTLINGNAILTPSWQFQPSNTSSVVSGGTEYPINGIVNQSSANTYFDPTNVANMTAHLDANYIVNVFSSSNGNVATAQLINFTQSSIDLKVSNLNGWQIIGNLTFI